MVLIIGRSCLCSLIMVLISTSLSLLISTSSFMSVSPFSTLTPTLLASLLPFVLLYPRCVVGPPGPELASCSRSPFCFFLGSFLGPLVAMFGLHPSPVHAPVRSLLVLGPWRVCLVTAG